MSFDVPDWDGDSFSYYHDESPHLMAFCARNDTSDQSKIKKRKKKYSKAEENTDQKELQLFSEAHENLPSPRKNLEKGGNTIMTNDTVEKETISKDINLQAVNLLEKNVTPPEGTGKQEVIENTDTVRKKAKKKKNSKRNKYKELQDWQRQSQEGREVCGFKKGNTMFLDSSNLPGVISYHLNSDCKKLENTMTPKKVCVSYSAINDSSTGKKSSHCMKTPQMIVKQDSFTDMSLETNQWKTAFETVKRNGEVEINGHGESSKVQGCGKIKKTEKHKMKQEISHDGIVSRDSHGGSDDDCGDKANKKAVSRKQKVEESESDVEIICEINDDEADQDHTLQKDLEAFITTLNLSQFSKNKKAQQSRKDENMTLDKSVSLSSKGIQEEPGDIKEKDEANSQDLAILDGKSDHGKEVVRDSIPERQEGATKEKKKTKRKKKRNEEVKEDKIKVSVSDNTSLVSDNFFNKEEKEESNEVVKESSINEKKKKNKDKIEEDTNKGKNMPVFENASLVTDNFGEKERGTKLDNVTESGSGELSVKTSLGDKIIEPIENKNKKRKRTNSQTGEVHKGTTPTEASLDISQNKKCKFDRDKLSEMLKAADIISKSAASQVSGGSLRKKMEQQLSAARFRFINEKLYSTTGSDAQLMFENDPETFQVYHSGYQQQVAKWPINPLDLIINSLKDRPSDLVVADFGCGEARLAKSVPQTKVHSLDLVALNSFVTECNMANTMLASESVDVVVFCLSLMGTSICDFILEANRVLKTGGLMNVAEVESRFKSAENFVQCLTKYGFQLAKKDTSHKFFWLFDFKKTRNVRKSINLPEIHLKPCFYKKR